MTNDSQYIFGDYVISSCRNAFNKKVSYWISKKGYTIALYCFTPLDEKDLQFHLDEHEQYIQMFKMKVEEEH